MVGVWIGRCMYPKRSRVESSQLTPWQGVIDRSSGLDAVRILGFGIEWNGRRSVVTVDERVHTHTPLTLSLSLCTVTLLSLLSKEHQEHSV